MAPKPAAVNKHTEATTAPARKMKQNEPEYHSQPASSSTFTPTSQVPSVSLTYNKVNNLNHAASATISETSYDLPTEPSTTSSLSTQLGLVSNPSLDSLDRLERLDIVPITGVTEARNGTTAITTTGAKTKTTSSSTTTKNADTADTKIVGCTGNAPDTTLTPILILTSTVIHFESPMPPDGTDRDHDVKRMKTRSEWAVDNNNNNNTVTEKNSRMARTAETFKPITGMVAIDNSNHFAKNGDYRTEANDIDDAVGGRAAKLNKEAETKQGYTEDVLDNALTSALAAVEMHQCIADILPGSTSENQVPGPASPCTTESELLVTLPNPTTLLVDDFSSSTPSKSYAYQAQTIWAAKDPLPITTSTAAVTPDIPITPRGVASVSLMSMTTSGHDRDPDSEQQSSDKVPGITGHISGPDRDGLDLKHSPSSSANNGYENIPGALQPGKRGYAFYVEQCLNDAAWESHPPFISQEEFYRDAKNKEKGFSHSQLETRNSDGNTNGLVPGLQPRRGRRREHVDERKYTITDPDMRMGLHLSGEHDHSSSSRYHHGYSDSIGNNNDGVQHMTGQILNKPKVPTWEDSSETVVRNAIQCLVRDKDMELSYISILSVINVLNSKDDSCNNDNDNDNANARDGQQQQQQRHQKQKWHQQLEPNRAALMTGTSQSVRNNINNEITERVGRLYSKLLRTITRCNIVEALNRETKRQDSVSTEAVYLQLYHSIQSAGYDLQDQDHFRVCQFLLSNHSTEKALQCLSKIETNRWNSTIFRTAISCHLFSKPRHLHEAEVILDRYLAHIRMPLVLNNSKSIVNLTRSENVRERERAERAMIQKWFKSQLNASKWEEIKMLYETRRTRLLETHRSIGQLSASATSPLLTSPSSFDADFKFGHGDGESLVMQQQSNRRGSTASSSIMISSIVAAIPPIKVPAAVSQPLPRVPEFTVAPDNTTTRSSFSLFSVFKSKRRNSTASIASTNPLTPTIETKSTPAAPLPPPLNNLSSLSTSGSSSGVHLSRHLTVLDNGMLEECVNHKQFEYGWKQVYERMGPALEDRETVKILMRLCKRAFLCHGELGVRLPGSPDLLTHDIHVDDDYDDDNQDEYAGRDDLGENDDGGNKDDNVSISKQEDPEIWEARAWVIYNKATRNPFFFNPNTSPSGSPTHSQHPTSSFPSKSVVNASATGSIGNVAAISTALTSPTTSLTVFLHNILTVAINSPEQSSRFLKAFKVYSHMRNDPLNQYQAQLRDPFVMTCMIKAIYETVLTIVRAYNQQQQEGDECLQQRKPEPETSATAQPLQHQQAMTIGPLIDLAFEIYADMRNVGPIRHLPHLSALAPSTSIPKSPKTPNARGSSLPNSRSTSNSMSMFFNLSSRPHASLSSMVDLSSLSSSSLHSASSTITSTAAASALADYTPRQFYSPASTSETIPCELQPLNPTLAPITAKAATSLSSARRLPNELYLALLHLCIQVPLSGTQQSSQVAKTIASDMMSSKSGHGQPANLDRHLAAALQAYHDRRMCRPQELKERRKRDVKKDGAVSKKDCSGHTEEDRTNSCSREPEGRDEECTTTMVGECVFHGWMYSPEECILEHMATSSTSGSSNGSSVNASICRLSNTTSATAAPVSSLSESHLASSSACVSRTILETEREESSRYSISKHDADLDELDQYLIQRATATSAKSAAMTGKGATVLGDNEKIDETKANAAHWMDGLDHDTCNDRFYWDFWSRDDPVLQNIIFSRRRARMLWRHVASLEER